MWVLTNRTAYAAERNWIRDKEGVHHWVVGVRATFVIDAARGLVDAEEQAPPALAPEHFGEPGLSSLRYDSDLLARKTVTDVLLDAHAHAPGGRPAPSVLASLRVGDLRKSILVDGDRRYARSLRGGITETAEQPFLSRPIRYEIAYGGRDDSDPDPGNHRIDARNPVGRGFVARQERLVDQLVPAARYPDGDVAARGPAGFGPIDVSWSPRRELAGTYDEGWRNGKRPLLPDDYDDRFGSCAPADQQVSPPLRGGERVELSNLTENGFLAFDLPKLYFAFTTRFGDRSVEHRARLTTVFIEPERPSVSMVWQTTHPVRPRDLDYLDETIVIEKAYV